MFTRDVNNDDLVTHVAAILGAHGYDSSKTLLATSLSCDEVSRQLERDFQPVFGDNFSMGGLAGFPFAGVTGFGAMAHHIPDGGDCLIVYGPHSGVDDEGHVGTVSRRGREHGGACCGSACAAAKYVMDHANGPNDDDLDAQQCYVTSHMIPYANRLMSAADPMIELPHCLFDSEDKAMKQILARAKCALHEGT